MPIFRPRRPCSGSLFFLGFVLLTASLFLSPSNLLSEDTQSNSKPESQPSGVTSEPKPAAPAKGLKLSQPLMHFPNELKQILDEAQKPFCGNGVLDSGEACDPLDERTRNNIATGETCNLQCHYEIPEVCQNGNLEGSEQCEKNIPCEDPNRVCQNCQCVPRTCGDGVKQDSEMCDDMNNSRDGSVRNSDCEISQVCSNCQCVLPSLAPAVCGDLIKEQREPCDLDAAGASLGCGPFQQCVSCSCQLINQSFCGNGRVDPGEQCGEPGRLGCPGSNYCSACLCKAPVCGNRIVEPGEGCDDGNAISGDGCSSNCTVENGHVCTSNAGCGTGFCNAAGICQTPVCGNSIKEGSEECDDGNTLSGDGCSSTCGDETKPKTAACGNGVLETGEQCETFDGNLCDASCHWVPLSINCSVSPPSVNVTAGETPSVSCSSGGIKINWQASASGCGGNSSASNAAGFNPTVSCPSGSSSTVTCPVAVSAAGGSPSAPTASTSVSYDCNYACPRGASTSLAPNTAVKNGCYYPITGCGTIDADTCCKCSACLIQGSSCECSAMTIEDMTNNPSACQGQPITAS